MIHAEWYLGGLIILGAILLDISRGDPPSKYHPTAWVGRLIAALAPRRSGRPWGVAVVALPCGAAAAGSAALLHAASHAGGALPAALAAIPYMIASIFLLKSTISIRGMERHAMAVRDSIASGDGRAAGALACIVKRKTAGLTDTQICSGAIESVAENTVDGTTAPLFYAGVFGVVGAVVYRAVNTADSMVGYRSEMFRDLGWFGANSDTALGWAPARLSGCVMVLAAAILRYDHAGAWRIMGRDRRKPDSRNSGYPMAAMAGALGITLEKEGHYRVGAGRAAGPQDIARAVRMMKCTSYLFGGLAAGIMISYWQVLQWVFQT